ELSLGCGLVGRPGEKIDAGRDGPDAKETGGNEKACDFGLLNGKTGRFLLVGAASGPKPHSLARILRTRLWRSSRRDRPVARTRGKPGQRLETRMTRPASASSRLHVNLSGRSGTRRWRQPGRRRRPPRARPIGA